MIGRENIAVFAGPGKQPLIRTINTYCCGIDSTPFNFEEVDGWLCNLHRILALHFGLQTGQFLEDASETRFVF